MPKSFNSEEKDRRTWQRVCIVWTRPRSYGYCPADENWTFNPQCETNNPKRCFVLFLSLFVNKALFKIPIIL